jgi:branched-chain amino acid transport system ATP-binding protein
MSAQLEIEGLEVAYGESQVLFGLDLSIAEGEVATLLGRNGMGKSTMVAAICGLVPLKAGRIRFAGQDIAGLRPDAIGRLGVGLVPEGRQVYPNLTVTEHLRAFAANRAAVPDPWTIERIFDFFPQLQERAAHMGNQLSGGEQQMLAIGRALSTNPRLLILDEATEGLAPLIREEIWRVLSALRAAGQAILVIDKYVERLIQLADSHTILERGKIAWHGTSPELDADHAVWHRYLGL